jgi:DNA (cytosine-5)-methyltransferase 1
MNKGAVFSKMIANFEDLGYTIYWKLLNCKDFGIPQSRQRVFIVGLHQSKYKNLHYEFPNPFLSTETLSSFFNKKFQRDYAHTIRCGGRGSKITSSYNWSNYYLEDGSVYALSIDDCKKLQKFSKDFIILGSKTSQWRQLGNTIPTNLSFCILKNLIPLIQHVKKTIPK